MYMDLNVTHKVAKILHKKEITGGALVICTRGSEGSWARERVIQIWNESHDYKRKSKELNLSKEITCSVKDSVKKMKKLQSEGKIF